VDFNAVGDPNAPIKIEEYSDFQCPFCRIFFEIHRRSSLENYVANGTVYFVYHSFGDFIGTESAAGC
jgi:protein-disulfide isomerase